MIRTILSIASVVLLIAGSGALVGFSVSASRTLVTGLEVDVVEIDGMFFVDAAGFAISSSPTTASPAFVADLSLHNVERWVRDIPPSMGWKFTLGSTAPTRTGHPTQATGSGAHFEDEPDFYIDDEGELLPPRLTTLHGSV